MCFLADWLMSVHAIKRSRVRASPIFNFVFVPGTYGRFLTLNSLAIVKLTEYVSWDRTGTLAELHVLGHDIMMTSVRGWLLVIFVFALRTPPCGSADRKRCPASLNSS